MSEKKNISAEQAYSLIKTMVQCGAVIIANDGMSEWTIEKKDTPFEHLAMDHIVMGVMEKSIATRIVALRTKATLSRARTLRTTLLSLILLMEKITISTSSHPSS